MPAVKNRCKINTSILVLAVLILLIFIPLKIQAADDLKCSELDGDAKKECKDLEAKAQEYQALIDLKNKQQNTLENQLLLIDLEQKRNQTDFQAAQKAVESLNGQIESLESDINNKEKIVKYQREILTGIVRSYYEEHQQGLLDLVLTEKDFSEVLSQSDYLGQSGVKLKEILAEILEAKTALERERNELVEKKKQHEDVKEKLDIRKEALDNNENQKQSLVVQTQGEEAKYQKLLVRVEEQKLELFDFSSAGNSDEVKASVKNYAKPDSKYWASTSWYYAQTDSRWGDKRIGNSKSLMKDYGCAVTSLAMVFKKQGASVSPSSLASQKMFYYDLIKWPGSWSPDIKLASSIGHGNINWKTVDSEIAKGNPVIVYIKRSRGGGHYVVIHNVVIHNKDSKDYVVHDPYFGANLYLGTSKSLVGKIGADSSTKVDQMIVYN
ncbi:MAG: C39 family peptidase [Candidatus Moranbacteria bacterium]|nr:C39 family peptidase [Candidatus Moranbacteria bacterium]